jgi:hypothetical protein
MADSDRPAATLTNAQRAYLRGEKDYKPSVENDIRSRIRHRISASIHDLGLIADAAAQGDLDVAESIGSDSGAPVWALPAILFLWTNSNKMAGLDLFSDEWDPEPEAQTDLNRRTEMFDTQTRRGIQTVLKADPPGQTITELNNELTIELGPDLTDVAEEDLPSLPRTHLDELLRKEEIDEETYAKAVKKRFDRVDGTRRVDVEVRPPIGMVDPDEMSGYTNLESFVDEKVEELEADEE